MCLALFKAKKPLDIATWQRRFVIFSPLGRINGPLAGFKGDVDISDRQRGQPWLLTAMQFNYPRFIVIIALSCLVKGISQFRTLKTQSFFCCVMLKDTLDETFEAPLMGTHSLKGHTSPRLWENSPFIYKSHEAALGNCEKFNHLILSYVKHSRLNLMGALHPSVSIGETCCEHIQAGTNFKSRNLLGELGFNTHYVDHTQI